MAVDGLPVLLTRKFRSSDRAYVQSSWMHSLRGAFVENESHKLPPEVRVQKHIFDYGQGRRIDALLADPATRIILQVATEDMDTIIAWAASRNDCLHFVFVRPAFRRQGIGKQMIRTLFPNGLRKYAVHTRDGDSFIVSRNPDAVYDPFAIDPRQT